MDEVGFVFGLLDLKILILFILRRLPTEIGTDRLFVLCQKTGVVNYFDFTTCLDDLTTNGQIREENGCCSITERGSRNAETLENSLPYSVRQHAEKTATTEAAVLSRQKSITARHGMEEGCCILELALHDGVSELIHMKMLCADEKQAITMEKSFRLKAEQKYQEIITILSE